VLLKCTDINGLIGGAEISAYRYFCSLLAHYTLNNLKQSGELSFKSESDFREVRRTLLFLASPHSLTRPVSTMRELSRFADRVSEREERLDRLVLQHHIQDEIEGALPGRHQRGLSISHADTSYPAFRSARSLAIRRNRLSSTKSSSFSRSHPSQFLVHVKCRAVRGLRARVANRLDTISMAQRLCVLLPKSSTDVDPSTIIGKPTNAFRSSVCTGTLRQQPSKHS